MKKRGFTLIELLAVIVVLAIIALIATPIVMNTIKNAKKGSAERGADNYIKQVETTIAEKRLENNPLSDGTYTIDENGNLTGNGLTEPVTIEMNGTKPNSGSIIISEGRVTNDSIIGFKDYEVKYNTTNKKYEATEKDNTPQVEVLCKANTSKVTASVYDRSTGISSQEEVGLLASESGAYTPGVTYTCELGDNEEKTFFVLEENGDNVSLIMDRNIDSNGKGTTSGNTVAWCKSGNDNSCAADGALEYLKNSTTGWTKLTESQISLPIGQQIATAGGDSEWTDSNYTGTTLSAWLYGNLSVSSAPHSYWTSTPRASSSDGAWDVKYGGRLGNDDVGNFEHVGIRPVITISKSQLG